MRLIDSDYEEVDCLVAEGAQAHSLGTRTDATIMVSADRLPVNHVNPFRAFERDLIPMVCAAANLSCALTSAPWQSAFPISYPEFGFQSEQCTNKTSGCGKGYPGTGFQAGWFDCVAGSEFSVLWSNSLTFSQPYMRQRSMSSAALVEIGFACHKRHDDLRRRLDLALTALLAAPKNASAFQQLCDRHGLNEACAAAATLPSTAHNNRLAQLEGVFKAVPRLTLAMEADYPPYSYINASTGMLEGFDSELLPLLCAAVGMNCTIVTAPFQSAWASSYPQFGSDLNNQYIGLGLMNRWFDCVSATWNTILRRPSAAFPSSYAQSGKALFVAKTGNTMRDDASDIVVGTVASYATGQEYLKSSDRFKPREIKVYPTTDALLDALLSDKVGAAFLGRETLDMWRDKKPLLGAGTIDFTNSKVPFDRLCAIFDDSVTMKISPGASHVASLLPSLIAASQF